MFKQQYDDQMVVEISRLEGKKRAMESGHPEWANACKGCGGQLPEGLEKCERCG